ncbi:MAG: hypothetical protein NXH75_14185, partial [Halobacteriovoraceae bacterium]|nr:hypothetical protein [Halobacteriovoraceae bacterium]
MAKPSCEEAHLPEGSQSLLKAAEEKMMNECNEQGENCFFSGATQADGIFNDLNKFIGGKIGGLGSFYQGNPAFLAENLDGLQHLEQVHAMLSHIARDSSEPTITENLRSIIGNAKRGGNAWDPSTGLPPAEIVDQMRTSAFDSSVSLVLREADGLSGDSEEAKAKREKFYSILEKLKDGGNNLKDENDYTIDGLYERYEELGLGVTPEDREIAGYVSMVATGQKHADNLIQREIQMAKTVAMVSSGNGERGPESRGFGRATNGVVDMNRLRQFRRQVSGVLKRARENPNTSVETVQTQLRGIFGDDTARSGLWASMAHFESLKDNSGNPAEALAFGARGVMSVMGKSLKSVLEDESRNAGISGLTDERKLKLTQMEALKNMAMRSAQTCNKLKQPSYKQGKFCTPLQDPDYANEALSNYMKGKAEGFLRRGEVDINEQKVVLSSALVYCAPILNDYEERDLIQGRHYDPLSPAYAQHKFNQCQKRTRTIFCSSSDSACNLNDPALKEQQIALFGQTCNSESLNSEDHRTRIGAAIANGDLDLISGDVTRPNIESGKVSINGTYNMEVSKKEGTNMTAIAQGFRGTTYGYTNKSGYKAKKGNGFIGASSNAHNDRLPDHFKSPMDSKIAASKSFSGENRQISIDSGGENFVPVDTITGDMADRVLETMTEPEEKDSELAKLLERLSSLEERLTKGADENEKGDEKDESLTALENEIKELRERLAKSSELKDRLATIDPSPRSEPTPTVIDPSDFVGDPGSVRNNKGRGRSIASVPSAGAST